MEQKFSIFALEKEYDHPHYLYEDCFEFIKTYNTLEEAKKEQNIIKFKTMILPSY